jgi:hypothetical protein
MELLLIAIIISAMLVFYPIRVRPRADLISPPTISSRFNKQFDSPFFQDPAKFPRSFYDYTSSKRDGGSCSICDADPCSLCGSTDCGNEYYICSLCSGQEEDQCPYCSPLTPNNSDFSRFRMSDSGESMFGNNDAFLSDDFDTGLYNHDDSLMASSTFSDLAVGHGEPVTEIFFYEGKRFIAATYSDTIVIRPADL